jgi:hypothetical protein
MANQIRVGQGVSAGLSLVVRAWRVAPGAAILAYGASVLNMTTASSGNPGLLVLGLFVALAADVVFAGALYRYTLLSDGVQTNDPRPGPLGLQWRATEWRLLSVRLLVYLPIIGVGVAAGLLIGVTLGIVFPGAFRDSVNWYQNLPASGWALVVVLGLVFIAFLMWLAVRLSLAPLVAVAEARISLGRSFQITQGSFWPLLGAFLVLGLFMIPIGFVAGFGLGILRALGSAAAGQWIYRAVFSVGNALFQVPSSAGLCAYVYERVVGPKPAVEVFD